MNESVVADFERRNGALASVLQGLSGTAPQYFISAGNAGDSLIASATYQLLKHYDIRYKVLQNPRSISNSTIVLAGGGNLVPHYGVMAGVIRQLLGRGNQLIILPHTIRDMEPLLAELEPGTIVFCRELVSYAHVVSAAPQCTVHLSHDMGLFLDVDALEASVDREVVQQQFEAALAEAKISVERIKGKAVHCMRHGVEKTFLPKGPNFDISVMFRTGTGPDKADAGTWMMLEFCRHVAKVTTNRLHVGISCVLVKTPLILHDNSYGKVSSVYQNSIKNHYTNIEFATSDPAKTGS